jgi:hypothetical protein
VSTGVWDFILDTGGAPQTGDPARLLEIGAQEAVLRATDGATTDAALDLRARSLMARSGAAAGAALAERLPRGSTARLVLLAQRFLDKKANAEATLAALRSEASERSEPHVPPFLTGVVLLLAGETEPARAHFSEVSALRPAWLGGWAGQVLALTHGKTEVDKAIGPIFAQMFEAADFDLRPDDTELRRRAAALG